MLNEYWFEDFYIRHAIDEKPDCTLHAMHIHEQCEIYLFISGTVEFLVEGVKYPLKKGSLMLMRPGEAHVASILKEEVYERYALNFPLSFASDIDPGGKLLRAFTERPLGKNNRVILSEENRGRVEKIFARMSEKGEDYDRRLSIRTNLFTLLNIINDAFELGQADEEEQADTGEKMVAYVNRHLFEEISIPDMAAHFYLSPSQFSRTFKRATGAAPWEYVMRKRLTKAKEMIRSGQSLRKVASECGFKDYSSFYRAFKKYFGISPINA